jgi:hypothetical protein
VSVVVFGYSAFLARRNVAPFALVIAPVLTRQLQPVVESVAARFKLPASVRQDVNPTLATALNGLILTLVILAVMVKCGVALAPQMIDKARRQVVPVRAVEWLKRSGLTGPMYNSYNWGGYLVWALPEEPVFVDGRTDIYEDEFLREYIEVTFIRPGWQEVLDRYGVRLALTERDGFLAMAPAMRPDWRLAYADDQAAIYVRGDR